MQNEKESGGGQTTACFIVKMGITERFGIVFSQIQPELSIFAIDF